MAPQFYRTMTRARLRQLARELGARTRDRPRAEELTRRVLAALPDALAARREQPADMAFYRRVSDVLLDHAFTGPASAAEAVARLCELADSPHEEVLLHGATALVWIDEPARMAREDADATADASPPWRLQRALRIALERARGGARPLLRRCLAYPDDAVNHLALHNLIVVGEPVDPARITELAARPHTYLRNLARAYQQRAQPTNQLLERLGAPDEGERAQALAALGIKGLSPGARTLPPEFTPPLITSYVFSDLPVMIAAALWREDPRGWEAPGWLLHHERRELRKAGRQLAQLHREFHRRALLRLLRRRPRPTA